MNTNGTPMGLGCVMYLGEAIEAYYRNPSEQSHLDVLSMFYLRNLWYCDQDFQRACRFATSRITLNWIYYDSHFGRRISTKSLCMYYKSILGDNHNVRFAKWIVSRHPNFINKMSIGYIVN
jgi:hypothetical protein